MEIIKTRTIRGLLSITLCFCAFVIGRGSEPELPIQAQEGGRVFELRMYTVEDGKVHLLSKVFRDNVTGMFAKHGMTNVAYFIPQDDPQCATARTTATILSPAFDYSSCEWSKDTLIYILGHPSREMAAKNWDSFRNDSEGLRSFREDYARAGVKVMKIESVFAAATDYSLLK